MLADEEPEVGPASVSSVSEANDNYNSDSAPPKVVEESEVEMPLDVSKLSPYTPNYASLVDELEKLKRENHNSFFKAFCSRDPSKERYQRPSAEILEDDYATKKVVRTPLFIERRGNRGLTRKKRVGLARHLSNIVGARVPFNFRYNIYEANVLDPRNKGLVETFHKEMARKASRTAARSENEFTQ
jgi:hypothetical protein